MKSKAEFENFYKRELKRSVDQLEEKRKEIAEKHSFRKYKRNLKWAALACLVIVVSAAVLPEKLPKQVVFCIPVTALYALIAPIVIFINRNLAFAPFKQEYKTVIVPKTVSFVSTTLTYKPAEGISLDEFNAGQLFEKPSSFKSEDLVHGKVDDLELRMADVTCTRGSSRNSKSTSPVTVFQGLYLTFRLSKKFPSPIRLKRKNVFAHAIDDFVGKLVGKAGLDKINEALSVNDVEVGNAEFDNAYTVESSKEGAARVLTPAVIQQMLETSKELNAPIDFSFFDNQMHCAVRWLDLFEVNAHTSITERNVSQHYFNALNSMIALARSVNS